MPFGRMLRQPFEDGKLTISRAAAPLTYPARCTLVAAMNPCPCGYATDSTHSCTCQAFQGRRGLQRIPGPLLDRTDIHIEVPRLHHEELLGRPQGEPSTAIRARVVKARQAQQERFAKERRPLYANRAMEAGQIRKFCPVDGEVKELLRSAMQQLGLLARAYHRILNLSRTIADLAGCRGIGEPHVVGCPQGGRSNTGRWTGDCWAELLVRRPTLSRAAASLTYHIRCTRLPWPRALQFMLPRSNALRCPRRADQRRNRRP